MSGTMLTIPLATVHCLPQDPVPDGARPYLLVVASVFASSPESRLRQASAVCRVISLASS